MIAALEQFFYEKHFGSVAPFAQLPVSLTSNSSHALRSCFWFVFPNIVPSFSLSSSQTVPITNLTSKTILIYLNPHLEEISGRTGPMSRGISLHTFTSMPEYKSFYVHKERLTNRLIQNLATLQRRQLSSDFLPSG